MLRDTMEGRRSRSAGSAVAVVVAVVVVVPPEGCVDTESSTEPRSPESTAAVSWRCTAGREGGVLPEVCVCVVLPAVVAPDVFLDFLTSGNTVEEIPLSTVDSLAPPLLSEPRMLPPLAPPPLPVIFLRPLPALSVEKARTLSVFWRISLRC